MTRPIDAVAAIQQPLRLQEVIHNAQRQAQIPLQSQEEDAKKRKAEAQDRVECHEETLAKTVHGEEEQPGRERRARDDATEPEPDQPHIDLVV